MKTIYLKPITFECHTVQNEEGTFIPYETDFFDDKCDTFIEGHRIKPAGKTWVREDGEVFSGGEMIAPWKPNTELDAVQREYERQQMADMENALAILLGGETV